MLLVGTRLVLLTGWLDFLVVRVHASICCGDITELQTPLAMCSAMCNVRSGLQATQTQG